MPMFQVRLRYEYEYIIDLEATDKADAKTKAKHMATNNEEEPEDVSLVDYSVVECDED
jgi:hypothetical protein